MPDAGTTSFINVTAVGAEYFRLMRIRLVEGTTFTDTAAAGNQAIVNEGLARRYWPGQSPIGKRLRVVRNGQGDWKTVVAVAAMVLTVVTRGRLGWSGRSEPGVGNTSTLMPFK